ncbi:InlB B-repeat-containing protein [Intestinimonas sp. MSJ-38]|nr:InlB B-repeat-containing protein [Intestinimonas sp. MSJ-38]
MNGKEYAAAPLYFTTLGTSIKPVSVLLNGNGGSVSPGFISVTLGKTYPALPTPVREGYTFTGWYTGTSSSAQRVSAGDAVPATPPSSLYAHWEKIPVADYTVTLHVYNGPIGTNFPFCWECALACPICSLPSFCCGRRPNCPPLWCSRCTAPARWR